MSYLVNWDANLWNTQTIYTSSAQTLYNGGNYYVPSPVMTVSVLPEPYGVAADPELTAKPKKRETDIAWLRRRVDEVCWAPA